MAEDVSLRPLQGLRPGARSTWWGMGLGGKVGMPVWPAIASGQPRAQDRHGRYQPGPHRPQARRHPARYAHPAPGPAATPRRRRALLARSRAGDGCAPLPAEKSSAQGGRRLAVEASDIEGFERDERTIVPLNPWRGCALPGASPAHPRQACALKFMSSESDIIIPTRQVLPKLRSPNHGRRGHWLHAEKPAEFIEKTVEEFLKD